MTPFTEAQKIEIVENVISAVIDISNLKKVGYSFLQLSSGFIAHYDLHGFISHYTDDELREDILRNKRQNQWSNFHPGERDYEYNMSKKDIYNRICAGIAYLDLTTGNVNAFSFNQVDLFAGVDIDLS